MRFLTVEQMRVADRAAVAEAGVPEHVLMDRAGTALAREVAEVAALRGTRSVVVVGGHGNNGGDAFVAARGLFEDGLKVQVLATCAPAALKGSALEAWDEMCAHGVPHTVLATPESWGDDPEVVAGVAMRRGVVVDGVLGTGCRGAPSGAAARAIRWINRARSCAAVVSADLPSGMDGDTGEAAGEVVRADVTVTFARPKTCFLSRAGAERVGHLVVADIGIPDPICDRHTAEAPCELIAQPEVARSLSLGGRGWEAHKGAFGHLCVIGGSADYPHAPVLAALGALRSGAGLVTLAVPPASAAAAAAHAPEAILATLAAPQGGLSEATLAAWARDLSAYDAVVAGPGLGASPHVLGLVAHLVATCGGRLVLDADGLNALARLRAEGRLPAAAGALVLTPHPGEAARLLGQTVAEVQGDRLRAVHRLADEYGAVAVLKGSGTLVCAPGGRPWLCRAGNPGMASGGTGDVLAGVVGALWAQGLEALEAAQAAVWAHGAAGDFAALAEGRRALTATALAGRLGAAFQRVERQAL